jgi:hypothetical protein
MGQTFSTIVCAAAPGSMFEANKFPDSDKAKIDRLIDQLLQIRAERFVLVSSIAVLADFSGQDDEGTASFQKELAYGRNRRALEVFCAEKFKRCLILRLPALFGAKMKKNFVFDLLNPVPSMLTESKYDTLQESLPQQLTKVLTEAYSWNDVLKMYVLDRARLAASGQRDAVNAALTECGFSALQFTNAASTFQFYNMERLWSDIEGGLAANLRVLHLAPEPVPAGRVHERLSGRPMPQTDALVHHEDMRTQHAGLWGRSGPYLDDSDDVLADLRTFFEIEKAAI